MKIFDEKMMVSRVMTFNRCLQIKEINGEGGGGRSLCSRVLLETPRQKYVFFNIIQQNRSRLSRYSSYKSV